VSNGEHLPTLVVIRHAEAEHHLLEITGGWTDTSLTERGRLQSLALAVRLKRELNDARLTQLATSDLQRAIQTAGYVSEALSLEPHIYPALRDLNNGQAANKTHAEARRLAIPFREPAIDWQPYPGAETWRQFYLRISDFMEVFTRQQTGPALIVSHAAVVSAIVAWWVQIGPEASVHFEAAPAALTVLNSSRWGERAIERLNDTAHLYAANLSEPLRI
jgi:broad specificity phosphatase PhoE